MSLLRVRTHAWLLGLPAGAALLPLALAYLPVGAERWLPGCPVHALTGLQCPGCGATRALAALGRGDLHAALALNTLAVLTLLLLALWSTLAGVMQVRGQSLPSVPRWLPVGALALTIAFGIGRNF